MKMIIHDLAKGQFLQEDAQVIGDLGSIQPCMGCFGCWIQTPGQCVLKDGYENMGRNLGHCEQLLVVSRCTYGGYSSFVKNVMDRSIPYIHPDFRIVNGQMHHKLRYDNQIEMTVVFYGEDVSLEEKATAEKLVYANAMNFGADVKQILFVSGPEKVEAAVW